MVKAYCTVLASIVFVVTLVSVYSGFNEQITHINAESVFDAAATSGTTSVSITVGISAPSLMLTEPGNKTYESNESILLRVDVTNSTSSIDTLYYSMDNGENVTLNMVDGGNTTRFDTSFGGHELIVYANETTSGLFGNDSVQFTVNDSIRFKVMYSKFNGSTTNLSAMNTTDLEGVNNMVLERSTYGKFICIGLLNLTNDNMTDSPIDLDTYINISSFIYVNESAFPNLIGGNATLYFYNATTDFNMPQLLRNGEPCPEDVCTANWTEGTSYVVNITAFSKYELRETPSGSSSSSSGSDSTTSTGQPSFPRRGGRILDKDGDGIPDDKQEQQDPTIELPFTKRLGEVTPTIVLNKPIVIIITVLIIVLLLLQYAQHRLHKSEK